MQVRLGRRCGRGKSIAAFAVVLAAAGTGGAARAQTGGPPPGGPFGGGPGFGRPGFGGPGRGPRLATLADVPASALSTRLQLSAGQTAKITRIQQKLRQQQRQMLPPPPPGGGRGNGGTPPLLPPPAPDRMRTVEQAAARQMEDVLTPTQKRALPALLGEINLLRSVGLPAELAARLNLSSAQKAKIAALAQKTRAQRGAAGPGSGDFGAQRQQTRRQVQALLTGAQRAQVEKFRREHPRFGPGGPGGGPGGFPGGPPPPPPLPGGF